MLSTSTSDESAHAALPVALVVDASAISDATIESLSYDFQVITADGADAGLRLLEETHADLLVCNFLTHTMQGESLIEAIRRNKKFDQTPIIALVTAVDEQVQNHLLDDAVQDYVVRPFPPAELLVRSKKLLALRRSTQLLATQARERASQLEESENRFRLMVESIEDYAMFMVSVTGHIISWNRGAERLTGYSEMEALGRHFSILYPREALDERHAEQELRMARRHGRHEEEGIRMRKDGSTYYAQIVIWPVEDRQGDIVGFAKITRDITVRRQAEQALKESEAKFRTITDAMPQMVWSTLPNGHPDYYNEQWYRFTGVAEGSADSESWNLLLHPDDQARAQKIWQQSLRTGAIYEIQYRLRHFSGAYRWTLGRALPVRDDSGNIMRWMGTLTDIHEQKQAEEALRDAARRKDEFLAMLAHELRNPLAPVRNSTVLLRRLIQEDERAIQALNVIERQVRHMTCLIDDLLDVARISRGKIEIRREAVDLIEVVRHTVEDFESDYQAKGVNLLVDITCWSLWARGDRIRIAQILGNLLHNALKFTEAGGQVSVHVSREDNGGALIKVSDNGIGLEPGLAEDLFNPFVQANQDLARSKGGLGLGLALVKGFIELHGGNVEVFSDGPGQGSVFKLRLPLMPQPPKLDRTAEEESVAGQALRILLIDDNRDMVETLAALLMIEGHSVLKAYDGESGIERIRSERPDLVLCDIGLPGAKDGYGVAREVRSDPAIADTFLVAVSGYGQEQDRQRALESGFAAHLLKPLEFAELQKVIAMARESRSSAD